jgi:hypothetical protein
MSSGQRQRLAFRHQSNVASINPRILGDGVQCSRELAKFGVNKMNENEVPSSSDLNDLQAKSIPPVMANQTVPPQMHEYPRGNLNQPPPPDETMKYLIPVNPSAWAVVAGYVGLFSVLALPAPFAIITGIVALKDLKKNPTKSGHVRAWFAITIGSFFTVLYTIAIIASLKSGK